MCTHLCILSDHLLGNFLPLKKFHSECILVIESIYTKDKNLLTRFKALVKSFNSDIKVKTFKTIAPTNDIADLYHYFGELAEVIKKDKKNNILNITGGNKLMALAALESLRPYCDNIIYTDIQNKKIISLITKKTEELPTYTIKEFLMSYGIDVQTSDSQTKSWRSTAVKRKPLTHALMQHFVNDKNFLSAINAVATEARGTYPHDTLNNPKQELRTPANDSQKALLKQCAENELIHYDNNKKIRFLSAEAAKYLNGHWFEEYVYWQAREAGVEVSCGQFIKFDTKVKNELDIFILFNNKVLVIECKTLKYKGKDSDVIYKLDSVTEAWRGLLDQRWLCSVNTPTTPMQERAKIQNIKIISSNELLNLKSKILEWKNT